MHDWICRKIPITASLVSDLLPTDPCNPAGSRNHERYANDLGRDLPVARLLTLDLGFELNLERATKYYD